MLQSAIIQYNILPKWYLIIIAMFLGGILDLSHTLDKKDEWVTYNKFHQYKWWKWFIPYVNLHLAEDYFVHKRIGGGMNKWYKPLEIVLWIIMLFIFVIKFI
jgi:hypothetical protein